MTLAPHPPSPSSPTSSSSSSPPLLRLRLASPAGRPRAIDGAWWPYSYDLLAELPVLLAGLPRTWGHIAGVLLNDTLWPPTPSRMFVAGQVVRLRRTPRTDTLHTVVLIAPGQGRWDLLVIPPETAGGDAAPLMERAVAAVGARR